MIEYYRSARAATVMVLCLVGVFTGVSDVMTRVQGLCQDIKEGRR